MVCLVLNATSLLEVRVKFCWEDVAYTQAQST